MVKSHQEKLTEAIKARTEADAKIKELENQVESTKKNAIDDFKASLSYKLEDSGVFKLQISDDETKQIAIPTLEGDNITYLNQLIDSLKNIETTWEETHSRVSNKYLKEI